MSEVNEAPGITFLRSTQHVRVLDKKGDGLRSVLVGVQFALLTPIDLLKLSVGPLALNIFADVFNAIDVVIKVLIGAGRAVWLGLCGRLEAVESPIFTQEQIEEVVFDEAELLKVFEEWWGEHGRWIKTDESGRRSVGAHEKEFAWCAFAYAATGNPI